MSRHGGVVRKYPITKFVLSHAVLPIIAGVVVVSWQLFQNNWVGFVVGFVVIAFISDLSIRYYPKIKPWLKTRKVQRSLSLEEKIPVEDCINLKLRARNYIYLKKFEIGTRERILITHEFEDRLCLQKSASKEFEFIRLKKTLGYFCLAETNRENDHEFTRFKQGIYTFDVHASFGYSKTSGDYGICWCVEVDYKQDGQIIVMRLKS